LNEEIIKSVKNLPPLPETALKVHQACANPLGGVAELTKVIEQDPMLTANLLKAANSPLYGFAREIKTLSQAISLFGFATVRGFAIASAARNAIAPNLSPYGVSAELFVELCQLQNALMVRWYGIFDRAKLEELSPASFLFSMGRLVMANEIVKQNQVKEFKDLARQNGFESAERTLLDASYQEVSAEIFTRWRFERTLIDAIRYSEDPSLARSGALLQARALRVVQIAVEFPSGVNENSLAHAVKTAADYKMPAQALENVAKTFINRISDRNLETRR
jgi:HD-like signal output (HDOD) protein